MRELKNNTLHDLTWEEHEAIISAGKLLSEAFKRRIYAVTLNPMASAQDQVWGIGFAFNMSEITKEGRGRI